MKKYDIINELYKDIVNKRNKLKITLDDYVTESEIIRRNIEYSNSKEDDSRFFSPRSSENTMESLDEMDKNLEKYEKLIEDTKEEFTYYDNYCSKISDFLKSVEDDNDTNKELDSSFSEDPKEDVSYSLNLNYDVENIKESLKTLENKIDVCLKIFDNDRERTRNEIRNISRSIKEIIDRLD